MLIQGYIKELDSVKLKPVTRLSDDILWSPPQAPFVKINFDATFNERLHQVRIGMAVRNSSGSILVERSIFRNKVASMFAAESLACLSAVQTSLDLGYGKAIFEGDALSVIKKCSSDLEDKSEIRANVQDIKRLSSGFQKRYLSTYRQIWECGGS